MNSRARGLISNKLHPGIKVDRWWSNDPKYTHDDITPLITTILVVTSRWGREAACFCSRRAVSCFHDLFPVCSFPRNRFTSKRRCVSAATCACATHACILRMYATCLCTKTRRVCNRWTSGLTRTWCATRRRPRGYSECAAVARICVYICVCTCESGACIEKRESKGLPAAARAQSAASEWDYSCQSCLKSI